MCGDDAVVLLLRRRRQQLLYCATLPGSACWAHIQADRYHHTLSSSLVSKLHFCWRGTPALLRRHPAAAPAAVR